MGMGLLRKVLASRARRVCAADDPLGRRRIKRQAKTVRQMHRVRSQGRDATTSRMGGRAHWISAVPYVRLAGPLILVFGSHQFSAATQQGI